MERSSAFGQFAIQEVLLRLALVHRDRDELRFRRELETCSYSRPGCPSSGPVDRVAERRVDEAAECEPEHPGVVVEDVELVGLEEGVQRVLHLPVRVPDPLARRRVEDGLEPRPRLRVARREERDVVSRIDETVGQERDDALGPAVRLRRHRKPDGTDKSRLSYTFGNRDRPRSTATVHVRPIRPHALDA